MSETIVGSFLLDRFSRKVLIWKSFAIFQEFFILFNIFTLIFIEKFITIQEYKKFTSNLKQFTRVDIDFSLFNNRFEIETKHELCIMLKSLFKLKLLVKIVRLKCNNVLAVYFILVFLVVWIVPQTRAIH